MYGTYGVGKTHSMFQIQPLAKRKIIVENNVVENQIYEVQINYHLLFWPTYIADLKLAMSNDEVYRRIPSLHLIKECEILIIDDIGGEMASEWMLKDILLPILEYRFSNKLFTCFTSNFTISELKQHWNVKVKDMHAIERCIERIIGMTKQHELVGKNWRRDNTDGN